jgi:multidrug efflux pump subunit AcrA (membrane-fusion protein)
MHNPKTLYLLAAGLLATCACSKKEEKTEEAAAPVQVAVVAKQTICRVVTADGVLYPHDQANVVPKITAPVQKFLIKRGDHVRQGQLLAVLESKDLAAGAAEGRGQLAQAESNYRATSSATVPEAVTKASTDMEAARETLDVARKLVESRRTLFQQGALPRRQVDEAQVTYVVAKSQFDNAEKHLAALQNVGKGEQIKTAAAQVETAKSHLQSAEAQLAYAEIRSPLDGVISDRPLYPGDVASPGTPLLTVMDISRVVARVNVPQDQAGFVKLGQTAAITAAGGGAEIRGQVIVVSPAADPGTTTVQVWVEAANPGEKLKPGTPVRASILTASIPDATVVPVSALLAGAEGGTVVMTVDAGLVVHERKVEVGVRETEIVQILSGAAPGEQVVVVGGVGVQDKGKVRIVKPGEKEQEKEK